MSDSVIGGLGIFHRNNIFDQACSDAIILASSCPFRRISRLCHLLDARLSGSGTVDTGTSTTTQLHLVRS
jgi:hypothetical protein